MKWQIVINLYYCKSRKRKQNVKEKRKTAVFAMGKLENEGAKQRGKLKRKILSWENYN